VQNVVVNMCEKFHNDRLRNDRALGNGKSDNKKKKKKNKKNKNKNNNNNNNNDDGGGGGVRGTWRPVSGSNNLFSLSPSRPSFSPKLLPNAVMRLGRALSSSSESGSPVGARP